MQAEVHIWRSADGDLVRAEDPRAAVLVYAPGDEVDARHESLIAALTKGTEAAKQADPAPNKARKAAENK